jgi:hypothetical protein
MKTLPLVCLTIVAEAVVERRLLDDLTAAGAKGWTVSSGHGRGSGAVRASEWEGANIRVESVGSQELVDRLLEVLARDYFPHYAVVAWTTPVSVVRPAKFV